MADDMMTITRRTLMTAAAGIGTAVSSRYLGDAAFAQTATRTRYSARSPRGKQMLAKYAKAVDIMKNKIAEGDPRHWNFQWYTHWIPGPQGPWADALAVKRQQLDRVYAGKLPSDPHRALAEAMWDTCQVHGADPTDPNLFQLPFFPPWHRLFVYHFEEIVRGVLKAAGDEDDFTLPYWNYLSDDVSDLSIPPEFRDPGSALFVRDRVEQVNAGQRIDWDNPGELNDTAFGEPVYVRPSGEGGFCGLLNLNPHRTVHTLVGNDTNMAGIPYAAKDPLFWVHHCEIDRLWESWCRLPNLKNPFWPDRSFVFADAAGQAVEHKCQDADRVAGLGYQYDGYYVPKTTPVVVSAVTTQPVAQLTRAAATAPVRLTADLVRVALQPSPAVLPQRADRTPERVKAAVFAVRPGRQLYLVLGNASLEAPADIRFNVYLELAEGVQPSGTNDPHYVGTFYFFDVEPGAHGPHASHDDHAQIFNITERVRALDRQGLLTGTPTVSLRPVGRPNPGARPTLGRINLVES